MQQERDEFSNQLINQIQSLIDVNFTERLMLGKYSQWAKDLSIDEVTAMLLAIGKLGQSGPTCPAVEDRLEEFTSHKHNELPTFMLLNKEQQDAISLLVELHWQKLRDSSKIPLEYSHQSPRFQEYSEWAFGLTKSDLFGLIWHVGGVGIRSRNNKRIESINEYRVLRAQEHLICLIRVAQGQTTFYQYGGQRFPLRERPYFPHCKI